MEITGKVVKRSYAEGSKSERQAVMLETSAGENYVLRRQGENAFHDPALDALVGQTVRCRGHLHGATFIIDDSEPVTTND